MIPRSAEWEALRALQLDAACRAYDDEALASAAGRVTNSTIPLDPDFEALAHLTGPIVELKTYGDAGRTLPGWLAAQKEAGVRD
jgi:hypothetical protein